MQGNKISLVELLRDGMLFRSLAHPLHMGKGTVQDCELVVLHSSDQKEVKARQPVTDILYTYLRPLNIRPNPKGGGWLILLPPSYSLYRVTNIDHDHKTIKVERIQDLESEIGLQGYLPYKCYFNSDFSYGEGKKVKRACVPEYATYIDFKLLPDISRPLLYLITKQHGQQAALLGLIYVSRPRADNKSIPVTYLLDGSFIWIGATKDDLYNMGFKEPPTNYIIREVYGRGRALRFEKKYSYDDLLEDTSVIRALRSYALVKVYVEASKDPDYSPELISKFENLGLYIRRAHGVSFKKVLLGSYLRTALSSSPPIFINIHTESQAEGRSVGVGVKIVKSEGLEFLFKKGAFEELVKGIIFSDLKLFKTLLLKYMLLKHSYSKSEEYYNFNAITRIISGVIQEGAEKKLDHYRRALYSEEVEEIIASLKKEYSGFIDYAVKVALYSLAHILAKALAVSMLHTELKNFTLYVDTEYEAKIDDKSDRYYAVMLLENAHEGLGFIEQFYTLISRDGQSSIGGNIVKYLIRPALQMLFDEKSGKDLCTVYYEEYRRMNENIVERLSQYSQEIMNVRKHVKNLVERWSARVGADFPSDFLRFLLYRHLEIKDKSLYDKIKGDAFLRNVVPYVYSAEVPFCWDGCERCVRLRESYLLSPMDQIFYISKGLAIHLLRTLYDALSSSSGCSPKTGSGLGREVLNLLGQAEREVRIMSPWLSPEVAKYIVGIAQDKKVRVRVITRPPNSSEPRSHLHSIRTLEEAAGQSGMVRVAYNDKLHAKVVIVDDKLVVTGSMNLTKHGTEINIENITVCTNKAIVYQHIADYEFRWQNSLRHPSSSPNTKQLEI